MNSVILRNRLRRDGYNVQTDAVNDSLQAIRLVRAHANEWNIDPNKIGIMGFSAGAELAAPAAILFDEFDKKPITDKSVGDYGLTALVDVDRDGDLDVHRFGRALLLSEAQMLRV